MTLSVPKSVTFPAIVAIVDDRFSPKAVGITSAEWKSWARSADGEIRKRIENRMNPDAVHLSAREWPDLRLLLEDAMGTQAAEMGAQLAAAPPYATWEMVKTVPEPLASMILRFRSANSCPVDRIHMPREEWEVIRELVLKNYQAAKADENAQAAAEAKSKRVL